MASSLLALLDDIATVLDDVAVLTKVAAKKTAGVLGDDLALNAEQVSGVRAERELPVVWAVFRGSLRNKIILVPAALAISAVAPSDTRPPTSASMRFTRRASASTPFSLMCSTDPTRAIIRVRPRSVCARHSVAWSQISKFSSSIFQVISTALTFLSPLSPICAKS